jgi:hypothetical protein
VPKVIQRETHAILFQRVHLAHGIVHVLQQQAFGQLQFQALCRRAAQRSACRTMSTKPA